MEDLLHERGIDVCHETVRLWWRRCAPMFAGEIRKKRVEASPLRHPDRSDNLPLRARLAAFLGLVPRQNSSGGKERLGRIFKMGDGYLRRLLVVGATSVIRRARSSVSPGCSSAWLKALLDRKPARVATVVQANKTARIAWALLTRGGVYQTPALT